MNYSCEISGELEVICNKNGMEGFFQFNIEWKTQVMKWLICYLNCPK